MTSLTSSLARATKRAATVSLAAAALVGLAACDRDPVDGPRTIPDRAAEQSAAPVAPAVQFTASAGDAERLAAAVADASGRLLRAVPADPTASDALGAALRSLEGAVERHDGAAVQRAAEAARRVLAQLDAGADAAADVEAIGLALDRVSAALRVDPAAAR